MKNTKKAMALLLAGIMAFGGCGNGNDGEGQEADSESIGLGADVDTEPDTAPEEPLQSITDLMISYVDGEESTISPMIMNYSEESVEAALQGFLLDGVAVEDWHVSENAPLDTYNPDSVSFPLDPSTGRCLPIALNANIYEYSEITVLASVIFTDGRDPLPLSATFQISELERPEDREPIQSSGAKIHIEAQELYNADGIVVTVPEQTLQNSHEPEIHLENSNDFGMYLSFMSLTVDGELIQEGSHNTSDAFVSASGSSDSVLPVSEILFDTVYSGKESGEITFMLFLTENQSETFGETAVTIPYTITSE